MEKEKLQMEKQIEIAKMCIKKGMPISDLRKMNIDITAFPIEEQAKLHNLYSSKNIDKSIKKALNRDEER